MDHNHTPGMEGMAPEMQMNSCMVMAHMTFFWSKNAEILFSGWPGTRTGMYVLALIFVFILSVLVEWLSYCEWIKLKDDDDDDDDESFRKSSAAAIKMAIRHGVKIALAYFVMLAVMSFNVGVLIVAVAGHTVGFFSFGCKKTLSSSAKLSPGSC